MDSDFGFSIKDSFRKQLLTRTNSEEKVNSIVSEIRILEEQNIKNLSEKMEAVKSELKRTQKTEKIQMAYEYY